MQLRTASPASLVKQLTSASVSLLPPLALTVRRPTAASLSTPAPFRLLSTSVTSAVCVATCLFVLPPASLRWLGERPSAGCAGWGAAGLGLGCWFDCIVFVFSAVVCSPTLGLG
jgi:hypothetical protein